MFLVQHHYIVLTGKRCVWWSHCTMTLLYPNVIYDQALRNLYRSHLGGPSLNNKWQSKEAAGEHCSHSVEHKEESLERILPYCLALLLQSHLHHMVRSPHLHVLRFHWALCCAAVSLVFSLWHLHWAYSTLVGPSALPLFLLHRTPLPCPAVFAPSSRSSPYRGVWTELCVLLINCQTAEHGDVNEYNCKKLKSLKVLVYEELLRKGICLTEWGATGCLGTLLRGCTSFQTLVKVAQKFS